MIKLTIYNNDTNEVEIIPLKSFVFNGGEVQVQLPQNATILSPIVAELYNSNDIMSLLLVTDAFKRQHAVSIPFELVVPYLPYARQDRVMEPGEALSVAVMGKLINGLKFAEVEIWDPHSDVSVALIDNIKVVPATAFVSRIEQSVLMNSVLVAPDAGASKKIGKVAKVLSLEYVQANKHRDTKTGEITHTTVDSKHIGDKDFLIVDDICDGGKTFTELAKVLRPLTNGKIYLYVTHGIFSKGLDVFDGLIDHLYVANLFPNVDPKHPKITILQKP